MDMPVRASTPALIDLEERLQVQRSAFRADPNPGLAVRQDRLRRLLAMIEAHWDDWSAAIGADFGHRSPHETVQGDVFSSVALVRHTMRRLPRWMRPQKVHTGWMYRPGRNVVLRQPLGVVGIVSPWNYPLYLSAGPLAQALAAGNRVLIKPSELTPRFSALLQRAVAAHFTPDEVAVITGDAEVGQAFTALPLDHLLFTGSTAVGRHVAVAAARQLTPVTLELGGKSPVIIDESADLPRFVPRLVFTKLFNAGQTCIAPDYAWVRPEQEAEFEACFVQAVQRFFPRVVDNPDYSNIVNERHHRRITALIDDARARGARVVTVNPAHEAVPAGCRKILPTLVFGATDDMAILREEIFGPVLPVRPYRELDEVLDWLAVHDRPLALYWFGRDAARRERVLARSISGGVCINDCMRQVAQDDAPFGGVGASGIGAYHGERGFLAFSHEKSVYLRSDWSALLAFAPPYKPNLGATLRKLSRWV